MSWAEDPEANVDKIMVEGDGEGSEPYRHMSKRKDGCSEGKYVTILRPTPSSGACMGSPEGIGEKLTKA
ncbi:MAG: hypothetical protein M3316_08765 [Actinomycetota bacterium]|nr:hypothetical protein [Actinomycetota bacterium]